MGCAEGCRSTSRRATSRVFALCCARSRAFARLRAFLRDGHGKARTRPPDAPTPQATPFRATLGRSGGAIRCLGSYAPTATRLLLLPCRASHASTSAFFATVWPSTKRVGSGSSSRPAYSWHVRMLRPT